MCNSMDSMRRMKMEERNDGTKKVACDVLRTLLVLGGAGWKEELQDGLAALTTAQNDLGSLASHSEVESALNVLREEGLIEYRTKKRVDPSGTSTIEDVLYSLRDYISTLQVFGADKPVLILREGER